MNARLEGRQVDFLWQDERVILDFETKGYRTARVSGRNLRRKPLAVLVRVGALVLRAA